METLDLSWCAGHVTIAVLSGGYFVGDRGGGGGGGGGAGAFRRRSEEIISRQDLDIGEAVSRGDFGDKLVQKLLQHLHYSVAVNNIFKVGVGGGGGVYWSSRETMGEEVISIQDLNIREAINGGDMFCLVILIAFENFYENGHSRISCEQSCPKTASLVVEACITCLSLCCRCVQGEVQGTGCCHQTVERQGQGRAVISSRSLCYDVSLEWGGGGGGGGGLFCLLVVYIF